MNSWKHKIRRGRILINNRRGRSCKNRIESRNDKKHLTLRSQVKKTIGSSLISHQRESHFFKNSPLESLRQGKKSIKINWISGKIWLKKKISMNVFEALKKYSRNLNFILKGKPHLIFTKFNNFNKSTIKRESFQAQSIKPFCL